MMPCTSRPLRFSRLRAFARRMFLTDDLLHESLNVAGIKADVQLRHAGNDFNHGGSLEHRRTQVRRCVKGKWSTWKDL
jgi:hypothetical protein